MSKPVKFRLTATLEYWGDPIHYGTSDPVEMAAVDMAGDMLQLIDGGETVWTIIPVEDQDNG